MTGLSYMQGLVRGEPVSIKIRFLEVFGRVDDFWRLIAWQSVKLTTSWVSALRPEAAVRVIGY
jgi:hypothetical protein